MKPNWIACCVNENAPEITAWLAIIVASKAMNTTGSLTTSGIIRKNGSLIVTAAVAASIDRIIAPCPI